MNVLIVYPVLPMSFWSHPRVTQITRARALNVPLGPLTIAALLPEGCDVIFVDLNVRRLTEKEWQWADIVMISGMMVQRDGFFSIIKEAVKRSKIVIAGGPYPSLMPEELIDIGCDFVVRGEGESIIEPLFEAIRMGITGKIIIPGEYPDLSSTPVPRFDLIQVDDYSNFLVQTTRGCPFSCEFCDIEALYGRHPRYKEPAQVISELESLYQQGARGTVIIADDNFIADKQNAKNICRELIKWNRQHEQPFGFSTQVSVNLGQDDEMIDLMTAANFGDVFIGIETPDKEVLKANRKHQNVAHPLIDSIDNIKRKGLGIIGSFIIGFDKEEKGAGERICDFVDKTHIPIVMLNMLMAAPGTRLRNRLEEEGRLLSHTRYDTIAVLPNFVPCRPLEELVEEYIRIWEYLYHPSRFFERTYKFCLAVRPTRRAAALKKGDKAAVAQLAKTKRHLLEKRWAGELLIFFYHIFQHGVLASYRGQYWKQLYGMYRHNPSRLKKYVISCISGDPHLVTGRKIREMIRLQLEESRKERG